MTGTLEIYGLFRRHPEVPVIRAGLPLSEVQTEGECHAQTQTGSRLARHSAIGVEKRNTTGR